MHIQRSAATIKIDNLKLQTYIGINEWERKNIQDIVLNISISFDASAAIRDDSIESSIDYRAIKKNIMREVESNKFFLLEKLTDHVLSVIMEDNRIQSAAVRIDKPGALRFADSVGIEMSAVRS